MGTRPTSVVFAAVVSAWLAACGAADNRVDPGDLSLRDLLGVAPHVAVQWDDGQRAAARAVIGDALDGSAAAELRVRPLASGRNRTERIARTLAVSDGERAGAGAGPLPLVRVIVDANQVTAAAVAASFALGEPDAGDASLELWMSPAWDREPAWGHLPGRGVDLLAAIARDAGHDAGPVVIVPAPRLAVAAAYVAAGDSAAEILVNPVVLAALEPDADELASAAGLTRAPVAGALPGQLDGEGATLDGDEGTGGAAAGAGPNSVAGTGGNPYSFYGSVNECAYAQRTRCETCLAQGNCAPVTNTSDGNGECTTLAASGGRGYFLLCINLSLSIASVDACAADEVPACPRVTDAASDLARLEANAMFLDDTVCAAGLDTCLADIYGAPPNPFPGTDGGPVPPDPPRDIDVSCGDSCDSPNAECSPSCSGGSGPSCNNAFSCDSACSSSNEQSGCGGNCEACNASSDSGGSTSAGCGGCESDGGGSGGGGGEACGSCDNSGSTGGGSGCDGCGSSGSSGSSGGSCDGCSSDSGGSSGGSDCGSCGSSGGSSGGGSDCGGSGCGSSGGGSSGGSGCGSSGGSSGSSCNVQRRGPPAQVTILIAVLWGLLPIPAAALIRRRARRKRPRSGPGASDASASGAAGNGRDDEEVNP